VSQAKQAANTFEFLEQPKWNLLQGKFESYYGYMAPASSKLKVLWDKINRKIRGCRNPRLWRTIAKRRLVYSPKLKCLHLQMDTVVNGFLLTKPFVNLQILGHLPLNPANDYSCTFYLQLFSARTERSDHTLYCLYEISTTSKSSSYSHHHTIQLHRNGTPSDSWCWNPRWSHEIIEMCSREVPRR
jgi:hypothetical protein